MPNWDRTPPVSGMSIEEMKKRVAAGIKRRRQRGELPPDGLRKLAMVAVGASLTKQQRRVMVAAAELAIYSLANFEKTDYCGAAEAIFAVCNVSGFGKSLFDAMMRGIAEQAADLSGDDFQTLDQLARFWLADYFTPSGKLISISKGNTNGNGKN